MKDQTVKKFLHIVNYLTFINHTGWIKFARLSTLPGTSRAIESRGKTTCEGTKQLCILKLWRTAVDGCNSTCVELLFTECLAFKLDQTLSNERVWCSSAIQQNPLTKKNWIDHLIFEFSQTLSWVIKQSGTHIRNTRMEQKQAFQFQAIDDKCVNYWSSVKAVKAM